MIIDDPHVLRDAVAEHVVPQGHEHSEDIVRDSKDRHTEACFSAQ